MGVAWQRREMWNCGCAPRGGVTAVAAPGAVMQQLLRAFSICSYCSDLEAADCPIWAALAVVVMVVGGGRGAVGNSDLTSAPTIALLSPITATTTCGRR